MALMQIGFRTSKGPAKNEVRGQTARILLSKAFVNTLSGRLLRIIVERSLAGQSDALKESVLGTEFFKIEGYDPSVHSNVRQAASRLRKQLAEYYTGLGAADPVRIEIPMGGYTAHFNYSNAEQGRIKRLQVAMFAIAGGVAAVTLTAVAIWLWTGKAPPLPALPVQLTFDSGFTGHPAISPDGNVLVYASDRGSDGIAHIWVKSGDSSPRQLTYGTAHELNPDLAPNGKLVVFRSTRDGISNLYLLPVTGASPTLLAEGYSPRFSPDGNQIVYTGRTTDSGASGIFVLGVLSRSEPRRIDFGVFFPSFPLWSRDGKSVIFCAQDEGGSWDYWVADLASGRAKSSKRVGIQSALEKQGLPDLQTLNDSPLDWVDGKLLFRILQDGPGNAFIVQLTQPDWRPLFPIQPFHANIEAGEIRIVQKRRWAVYPVGRYTRSIWSLILNPNKAPVFNKTLEDVTLRPGYSPTWPGLSADGRQLCFTSDRQGTPEIFCRDLVSGRERSLAAQPFQTSRTLPNRNGQRVAFLRRYGGELALIVREIERDSEREITRRCPVLMDWYANDESFLCLPDQTPSKQYVLSSVALATGEVSTILTTPKLPLQAQVSPDGSWLALVVDSGRSGTLSGYVIPLRSRDAEPRPWIKVVEESFNLSLHWSPDGNRLYYWHMRDGFRCLWAQELDPRRVIRKENQWRYCIAMRSRRIQVTAVRWR